MSNQENLETETSEDLALEELAGHSEEIENILGNMEKENLLL
ncbi:MAG: hypothetical protein ABEJ02_03715 [Candidatus Paceibacteria bacterium]